MPQYIVNKTEQTDKNGKIYFEVHKYPKTSCSSSNYPEPSNQIKLGTHEDCHSAIKKAKDLGYKNADGCYYCCRACHKR